jgi:ParB family chromosome partitioning protein
MLRNKTTGNLALSGYDDIFQPTIIPTNINIKESILEVPIIELHPPEFHPFHVNDDESMIRLSENIKLYGVREPGLVRPHVDNGYELLCGNRRKRACELAGIETMPIIIRNLSDSDAVIAMVDSNLEQREKLLFSEKAWAYRVKLEALNHNGKKGDMLSVEVLVEQTGESKNQIFRLVRLTELIITLLDKVDNKQLAFNPAVELSYLSQVEQTAVATAMEKYDIKPSLSQAVRLKKMKQAGDLTLEAISKILSECKDNKSTKINNVDKYKQFFPSDYSPKQMDTIIINLLKDWKAKLSVMEVA